MKLNKAQKIEIVTKMAAKAIEKDRAALIDRAEAFIKKAYEIRFKDFHDHLAEIMSEEELAQAFYIGFSCPINVREDGWVKLEIPPVTFIGKSAARPEVVTGRHTPYMSSSKAPKTKGIPSGALYIEDSHQDYEVAKTIIDDIKSFVKKADGIIRNLQAIVYPCSTDSHLIELIPEAGPFIPAEEKPVNQIVPISTINAVREALKGAA